MPSLKVLIVDDYLLIRNGLKQLFTEEFRGVVFGEALTAAEALDQVAKHPWDLVILNIGIPGRDGFQVLKEILLRRPGARVLVLSVYSDPHYEVHSLELGAVGYLRKNASRSDLVKAFRRAISGRGRAGKPLPPNSSASPAADSPLLSAREHKVLIALAAGKGPGEIAADLGLSVKTVSTYKRRILNKLHLNSTVDLVRYVISRRLS